MLAAEVNFIEPPYRSVQVSPTSAGNYLLTFYDRGRPLPGLEKLPFRRTQWTAVRNGHRQPIYLSSGQLGIEIVGDDLALKVDMLQLPAFLKDPNMGVMNAQDFEAAMSIADRM